MSMQPNLPPLNIAIPTYSSFDNAAATVQSTLSNSREANPRSPGYPRGFESLLAPLGAPHELPRTSFSDTTYTGATRPSIDGSVSSQIGDSKPEVRDTSIPDDRAEALWNRLAMIEGRRYNVNSHLLAEDRKQCKKLLSRLNTAGGGSLSSFSCLVSELFQLKPCPGLATAVWNERFGSHRGSKGKDLALSIPFRCEFGYNLHFGDDVRIGPNCYFNDATLIRLGNGVSIGKNVRFDCSQADLVNQESSGTSIAKEIHICDGVAIGDDVTIYGGVTVGSRSRICANITLTESIDENCHLMIYQQPLPVARSLTQGQPRQFAENKTSSWARERTPEDQKLGKQSVSASLRNNLAGRRTLQQAQLPTTCDPYAQSSAHSLRAYSRGPSDQR